MKKLLFLIPLSLLAACFKGEKVDLIIHNARIHTMNDAGDIAEAMAVKDGKILQVGPEREILNKYRSENEINAGKRDVYPGLHDAHGHIMSYAKLKLTADLVGSSSYYEMLMRLEKFYEKNKPAFLVGRGWDQGVWGLSELPDNSLLNERFPTIPVALTRVDGHAMLVNDVAMRLAGIDASTQVEGGMVVLRDGMPTGILLDHAIDLVSKLLPAPESDELKRVVLEIQDELFAYGITHVHEAGITKEQFDFLDQLAGEGLLKINMYAMLFLNDENLALAEKMGDYRNGSLRVKSFKMLLDGALGSRGACLLHPYSDAPEEYGLLLTSLDDMGRMTARALEIGYQVNTHCIGDSANRVMLRHFDKLLSGKTDHRWRIEHAQVLHPEDLAWFSKTDVIPSVQPTHAVSDQRWAEKRLGAERMELAYAYKTLLNERGILALGTDFPVESPDPFGTIHAAVQRKSRENEPESGFQMKDALTLEETMKGMTIWAAFACFEENRLGSLEKGKDATFAIFEYPIASNARYEPNGAFATYVKGERVY
jgi:predicted amidohydrolase YtcJ